MRVLEIRMEEPPRGGSDFPVSIREYGLQPGGSPAILATAVIPQSLLTKARYLKDSAATLEEVVKRYRERGADCAEMAGIIGSCLRAALSGLWAEMDVLEGCRPHCDPAGGEHVRIYFNISAPRLSVLPWELIIQNDTRAFVPGVAGHLCLRGSPRIAEPEEEPVRGKLPIRVLIIAGDALPGHRVEREIYAIQHALSDYPELWHVNVLRSPTQGEVALEFNPDSAPHILHLIGHSLDSEGMQVGPGDRDPGRPWRLSRGRLADLVPSGAPGPRLLVLNTCDSFELIPRSWFSGSEDRAVVATYCDVDSEAAAVFAKELYEALAESGSIAESARRARRALVTGFDEGYSDWSVPVLLSTGVLENTLPYTFPDLRKRYDDVTLDIGGMTMGEPPSHPRFDQVHEHRALWKAVTDPHHLVTVVTGDKELGKTTLVTSFMTTWLLAGRDAAYVDMLQDGMRRVPLPVAVARILRGVATALRARGGLIAADAEGAENAANAFQADADRVENVANELERREEDEIRPEDFAQLVESMKLWSAQQDPLLIVIDHGEAIADANESLVHQFFAPVAKQAVNARFVVVSELPTEIPSAVQRLAEARYWSPLVHRIKVTGIATPQAGPLFRELASRWDIAYEDELETYITEKVPHSGDELMLPGALIDLANAYRSRVSAGRGAR